MERQTYRVGFLVRSSALQADETGSIPVRDANLLGSGEMVATPAFEAGARMSL